MGVRPNDAMSMTFKEIDIFTRGWNDREREQWRQGVSLAHLTASLVKTKNERFPTLQELLAKAEPETPEQQEERIWDTITKFARPGELTYYKPSAGKKKQKKRK